jgi:glycosyltransferase involved in cell wall biosynthesis
MRGGAMHLITGVSPMRILQLAPLWEAVPPPAYGGTEAVVSLLTEELVRRGHDVTLAASGDSQTSATHLAVYGRSLRRADDLQDRNPYDWSHIALSLRHARDFDVVHNHAGELAMAMSHLVDVPMLTTMHCLVTPDTQFVWDHYAGAFNTISRSQRPPALKSGARAQFAGHVYNAIDVESFPFEPVKGDDLLFLSRIAPEKGPQQAIEAAKRLGRRLIIAGKVDQYDRRFYEEVVKDLIDGEQIVFFGEADALQKRELYRTAHCLLMPLMWEEPFGLVMPEAMACGTPVVAFRRGSAPELIRHGETGYIVDNVDEMVEAVQQIGRIDPAACRAHVQEHFSPAKMATAYVRVYERLLGRPGRSRRLTSGLELPAAAAGKSAVA